MSSHNTLAIRSAGMQRRMTPTVVGAEDKVERKGREGRGGEGRGGEGRGGEERGDISE